MVAAPQSQSGEDFLSQFMSASVHFTEFIWSLCRVVHCSRGASKTVESPLILFRFGSRWLAALQFHFHCAIRGKPVYGRALVSVRGGCLEGRLYLLK